MLSRQLNSRPVRASLLAASTRLAAGALAVGLTLGATAPAAAQARERDLYVSALDSKNAAVPNLGPADFIVREDGVQREILRVTPASEPMQITLLVDDSQRATRHIQRMREGLEAFIAKMATNGNTIGIVTLADRPTLVVDATTDPARLKKNGVDRLFARSGAGMYLLDAINDTCKGYEKKEATRPVIVAVITEGVEFSNGHYQLTLDALKKSGAAFYALVLTEGREADPTVDEIRNRNVVLDRGTRDSGGRRETILSDMAIQDGLVSIANELLGQYKVTYSRPDSLIPPEKVTVEVKAPNVTARGQLVQTAAERRGARK